MRWALALFAMCLFVACSPQMATPMGKTLTATVFTSPAYAEPSPTVIVSPTFLPLLTVTPPASRSKAGGQPITDVRVTTDRQTYRRGEKILVTIVNDLSVTIYAQTGQTYCTTVAVQRKTDSKWQMEGRCAAGAPPGFISIPPMSKTVQGLMPQGPFDKEFVPGQYRIAFTFSIGSSSGPWLTVHSEEFHITD